MKSKFVREQLEFNFKEPPYKRYEAGRSRDIENPSKSGYGEGLSEEEQEKWDTYKKEAQWSDKPLSLKTWEKKDIDEDDPEIRLTKEDWEEYEKADKERAKRWEKEKERLRKEHYPDTYTGKKEAAYGHSFSPEFYGDVYSPEKKDRPTNVTDALASMSDEEWNEMAKEVFNVDGDMLGLDTVMSKIMETDTVGTLSPPVDVWIDEEGYYTVDVYEEGTENNDEFYTEEELTQAEEDLERESTWFSLVNEGR